MALKSLLRIVVFLGLTSVLSLLLSPFMNVLLYWALHPLKGLGAPERFLSDFRITGRLSEWTVNHFSIVPALLLASLIMIRWEHRPLASLGFSLQRWGKEFGLGVLLALLYGVPVWSLLVFFAPYTPITTPSGGVGLESLRAYISTPVGWIIVGIIILLGATWEELVFRGYPFQVLLTMLGKWLTILIVSGIFAVVHFLTHSVSAIVTAGFLGLLIAVLYLQSRSLWSTIGFHTTVNATAMVYEISGVVERVEEENWLWTGATAVMTLILTWWMLRYIKPHSKLEALWQQYVPIAQPWAQLKSWWAKRGGQHPKDASSNP